MRKGKLYSVTGLMLLLCLLVSGCSNKPVEETAAETPKIPVTVEEVKRGDLERKISLGGLLKPQDEVSLTAKNPAARILEVPVQVGDVVKPGTPLVIFDSRDLDIQLNQAKVDYDRNSQLYEMGALSQYQLEQSKNLLDNLLLQKETMVITSPIKGIVSSVAAVEGQLAGATPLVSVVNIDKVKLEVQVGEANIGKIEKGGEMTVSVPAIAKEYTGIIVAVPPQVDARTKAYQVSLEIENPDYLIKGGMYGEVQLVTDRKENVVSIPQQAILDLEQKKVVYIVENDTVRVQEVEVGLTLGDAAEITAGLKGGEMLVVEGQYSVKDGTAVAVQIRGEQQ